MLCRSLTQARYGISWGVIGSALATYQCALDYAQTRIQFDVPIARFQIHPAATGRDGHCYHPRTATGPSSGGTQGSGQSPSCSGFISQTETMWDMAVDVARKARTILGASGIVDDYPVMRHLMNLESVATYEGTHDIHTLIVGNYLTGIQAFHTDR